MKVRCADCGFLCYRDEAKNAFEQVGTEARRSGDFPSDEKAQALPHCFVSAYYLADEYCDSAEIPDPRSAALAVITRERACGGFCQWRSGLSPREHFDLQYQEELRRLNQEQRERDRAFEQECRRRDEAMHEQRRQDDERRHAELLKFHAEQARLAEERWRRAHGLQRWQLFIVGVIATIVLAAAQLMGPLIQSGWRPWEGRPSGFDKGAPQQQPAVKGDND